MSKRLRFILATILGVTIAVVLSVRLRQDGPRAVQASEPPIVSAPALAENTLPQTGDLLAMFERVPGGAAASPQPARLGTQPGGAIRFLGVEPGWRLPAGESLVPGDPAETARRFLLANREAFGLANHRMELTIFRTLANPGRTSVRLQQTYGGLPVLVAETVVQVSDAGDIQCVLADLGTHVASLDYLPLPAHSENPRTGRDEPRRGARERSVGPPGRSRGGAVDCVCPRGARSARRGGIGLGSARSLAR